MSAVRPGAAPPVGGAFALIDHDGRPVTNETFHGTYALVFFGFTHCRVVCPRALGRLSSVLELLGPEAARVQPLYITVDPDRDSPAVMKAYLENRPGFLGLTGSHEQIEAAKAAFRVFARRREDPEDPDGYAVPHTAITYVINPEGVCIDHFTDALGAQEVAERLRALIAGGPSAPGSRKG
ncbi:SCO family protein [Vitiosangium sp. GDMCC 1.1324]|uniref:SCO family protein n=1 Tax=Vitiosangium sp. (strain GDMCC 1.1324) TaxID=2138576 RepID=UPI000D3DC0C1|nr:SCO family protein [Vitiosangium sp. GDMCC 1.1324]PTL81844.1 SCO family protein [Vitiosangium sp. GDMCC 1.1324]